ncbi:MAG: hypothetical protein U0871_27090 [Gemmataceae bacterium]
MGDRRNPDWTRAMDEVGEAVAGYLAALDAYETTYQAVLTEAAPAERPVGPALEPDGWEDRLANARTLAAEVEQLLHDQEAVWTRWRDAVADWRRVIEQPPVGEVSQSQP